jgi:hypothetical protein
VVSLHLLIGSINISKINLDSTPSYLDLCPLIFLPLVACMSLPTSYSISQNTAKNTTFAKREKDSPKPKKTAKG